MLTLIKSGPPLNPLPAINRALRLLHRAVQVVADIELNNICIDVLIMDFANDLRAAADLLDREAAERKARRETETAE